MRVVLPKIGSLAAEQLKEFTLFFKHNIVFLISCVKKIDFIKVLRNSKKRVFYLSIQTVSCVVRILLQKFHIYKDAKRFKLF